MTESNETPEAVVAEETPVECAVGRNGIVRMRSAMKICTGATRCTIVVIGDHADELLEAAVEAASKVLHD